MAQIPGLLLTPDGVGGISKTVVLQLATANIATAATAVRQDLRRPTGWCAMSAFEAMPSSIMMMLPAKIIDPAQADTVKIAGGSGAERAPADGEGTDA